MSNLWFFVGLHSKPSCAKARLYLRNSCFSGQGRQREALGVSDQQCCLEAELIGDLYRQRGQVALFCKWIKQHLRIKVFFGTSENAVKTQISIAISTYLLIAIVKKRLHLDHHSLFEILLILSPSMLETIPINQLFTQPSTKSEPDSEPNQFVHPLMNVGTLLNPTIRCIAHQITDLIFLRKSCREFFSGAATTGWRWHEQIVL